MAVLFDVSKDFYSHSNWVELGKKYPNANLIRSDNSIGNIAGEEQTATVDSVERNAGMSA